MAHYAYLNDENIVTAVITGVDENDTDTLPEEFSSWEEFYGNLRGVPCKRTSYNTIGNTHRNGGTPFRGNYACTGDTYDADNDVFIPAKHFNSWVIDETTWRWKAPVDMPDDGNLYVWNEETTSWDAVP